MPHHHGNKSKSAEASTDITDPELDQQKGFVADIAMPGDLPVPPIKGRSQWCTKLKTGTCEVPECCTVVEAKHGFVADISMPEDIVIAPHESGHHHTGPGGRPRRMSMDMEQVEILPPLPEKGEPTVSKDSTSNTRDTSISHDKVHRTADSISSLGPVSAKDNFASMQEFQKELVIEADTGVGVKGQSSKQQPKVSADFEMKTQSAERNETTKDVTISSSVAKSEDVSHEEQKGFFIRAVENVAAAAGTVVGLLTSAPTNSGNSDITDSVTSTRTEETMEGVYPEEKGLVDTAIEKVWNVLTGKEELFPVPEKQENQMAPEFPPQQQQFPSFHQQQQPGFAIPPQNFAPAQPIFPNFVPAEVLMAQQQALMHPQFIPTGNVLPQQPLMPGVQMIPAVQPGFVPVPTLIPGMNQPFLNMQPQMQPGFAPDPNQQGMVQGHQELNYMAPEFVPHQTV